MGALGLEGWGRRPQGKGCLLLAVAGATSLVTLLLAVPITVLAVLVVVPQEQGGLVSGCNKCPRGLYVAFAYLPLAMPRVSCLTCSAESTAPGGDVCLVCLFAGVFHIPEMLLYPNVSKLLPGCLLSFSQDVLRSLSLSFSTSALLALPSKEMGVGLPLMGQTPGLELGSTFGGVGLASAKTELWHCDPTHPGNRDH